MVIYLLNWKLRWTRLFVIGTSWPSTQVGGAPGGMVSCDVFQFSWTLDLSYHIEDSLICHIITSTPTFSVYVGFNTRQEIYVYTLTLRHFRIFESWIFLRSSYHLIHCGHTFLCCSLSNTYCRTLQLLGSIVFFSKLVTLCQRWFGDIYRSPKTSSRPAIYMKE